MDRDLNKTGEPSENGSNDSSSSSDMLPLDFGERKDTIDHSDPSRFPKIAGYTILGLLGQGGMGAVYRAIRNVDSAKHIAIKTMRTNFERLISDDEASRFLREIEILSSCDHPHVVKLLDHGRYRSGLQKLPYYTMELSDKGNLGEWLADNKVESKVGLRSIIERIDGAIRGLVALHKLEFVHRDLKPSNLLIDSEGKIKIGDFGLAKRLAFDEELTKTIGNLGTTPYSPPEQLLSAKLADQRADIYSIGVILYQLVCFGRRPFEPDNMDESTSRETDAIALWQRSQDKAAPVPSDRKNHLSDPSLDFIVQKCLSFYPEHRYQTAAELSRDIGKWIEGKTVRGSYIERLRNRVIIPLKSNLALVLLVGLALVLISSVIVAQYFFNLSKDLAEVKENAENERRGKNQVIRKRVAELRLELQDIVPRLKGEPLDHETERLLDPEAEFAKKNKRAEQIAGELNLRTSQDFRDRHLYWVIQRNALPPALSEVYLEHIKQRIAYAKSNLQTGINRRSKDDNSIAISDLLRSLRNFMEFLWYVTDKELQSDVAEFLDIESAYDECHKELAALRESGATKGLPDRDLHLKLLTLEFSLKNPGTHQRKQIELCRENRSLYSAKSLADAQCKSIHPWYVAWWIFEVYSVAGREQKISTEERLSAADGWLELMELTPELEKEHNPVHIEGLFDVRDSRCDVIRDMGDFEAARIGYEEMWQDCKDQQRTYFRNKRLWHSQNTLISSMLTLAEKQKSLEYVLECYAREQQMWREKISYGEKEPGVFEEQELVEAHLELAESFYRNAGFEKSLERQKELLTKCAIALETTIAMSPENMRAKKIAKDMKLKLESLNQSSEAK